MSLAGRGIVITRPRELAERLAALLESRGARAIVFPTIEIQPLPAPPALASLADCDLVVFISPSAVRAALQARAPWPPRAAAAIGAGTRRELERAGVQQVLAPAAGADSEALLAMPELQRVHGKRVVIVRGQGGRELVAHSLTERGAKVEYAECYRRALPRGDASALLESWRRGALDAITLSSAQALDNLIAMGGAALIAALALFVPHERIARHARAAGAREVVLAGAGDDEVLERLVAYFDDRS
jgi:uroporphyrinogen-III synthase